MFLLLCCLFFCFFLVFDNNDDTVHATYYYFIVGLVFYFSFCGSEKGPNVFWSFLFALVFVGFWNIIELWESLLVHGFWCSLTKFFAMHRMRSDLLVWSILAVKSLRTSFIDDGVHQEPLIGSHAFILIILPKFVLEIQFCAFICLIKDHRQIDSHLLATIKDYKS